MSRIGRWARYLALFALGGVGFLLLIALSGRVFEPLWTPLMILRAMEAEAGADIRQAWIPLSEIDPDLQRAVIASEDAFFCDHFGVDLGAMRAAYQEWREDGRLRGASTLTMQTARSVYLTAARHALRKLAELALTPAIELTWPKRRILEMHLNYAEWGDGVFGVEAAAQEQFGRSARSLTLRQAALLATVLPAPARRKAGAPSAGHARLAQRVMRRVGQMDWAARGSCLPAFNGSGGS